jgi:hypothetical protein
MTSETSVQDEESGHSECWCCGQSAPSGQMVRLGNHPEVALCLRCARFVAHRANEIEDRQRTGPAVLARNVVRRVRRAVVDHGWHNKPIVGPGLQWLGRHLP